MTNVNVFSFLLSLPDSYEVLLTENS